MLGKKVVGTAEAVFKHCKDNLEITTEQEKVTGQENTISIRECIYVDSQTVNRANLPEVSTLKGTRKIHELRNTQTVGEVEHRNLSCYCHGCELDGLCVNQKFVSDWYHTILKV